MKEGSDGKSAITYETLLSVMKKSEREFDLPLIDRAYRLAESAHKDQKRLSGEPYIIHPLNVACIIVELGMDSESVVAALLHDVVEDTPWTLEQIRKLFWGQHRQFD